VAGKRPDKGWAKGQEEARRTRGARVRNKNTGIV